jgi:hypothetical protein
MYILKVFCSSLLLLAGASALTSCGGHQASADATEEAAQGKEYTSTYICPMHCAGSGSEEPGKCPVCKMDYVLNEDKPEAAEPAVE